MALVDDDNQVAGVQDAPADDAQVKADKATDQPNEADVQVKSEAPEATQDKVEAKEAETTEVKAEDKAEESLLLGKFKNPEDLAAAYEQLESKATKDAMEKAELSKILNEAFTPEETQPAPQTVPPVYEDEDDSPEPDLVTQKLQALEQKDAVRDFIFMHPDADGKSINEVLTKDPMLANINGYQAKLEYAYLKSKELAAPQALDEATKKAKQETTLKTAEKQNAQVESARQQAQPAGNEPLSQEQLREVLRDPKKFDELIQKQYPGVSKMRTQT